MTNYAIRGYPCTQSVLLDFDAGQNVTWSVYDSKLNYIVGGSAIQNQNHPTEYNAVFTIPEEAYCESDGSKYSIEWKTSSGFVRDTFLVFPQGEPVKKSTVSIAMNGQPLTSQIALPFKAQSLTAKLYSYTGTLLEQKEIGQYFFNLDNLIPLHQRKLDQLKKLKKYFLQNMFPAEGEKVPRIRFKGFTGDWEQRKIFELFKITRGHVLASPLISDTKTGDKPYPVFSSQTKNNGLMGYYKDYLYQDAITWTTDGANAGTVNYRAEKFYCTNVCGVLLADKVIPNQMIAEALNKVAKRHVSYVGNPKLMNNVMADIEITLPDDENERKRISYLFDKIDNLITLHQRKLDQLQTMKKFLLQNMFI